MTRGKRMDTQAGALANPPAVLARPRRTSSLAWMWSAFLLAILAFLVIYPVLMLLLGALTGGDPVVDGYRFADLSLRNFETVLGNENVRAALFNSLIACAGGTAMAVLVGLAFAWIVVRTDTPWKGLIAATGMLPLFVPPLVGGVAWAILGSPKTGLLNIIAAKAGLDWRIDLYSMPGIIFVFGMYYAPYVYMFTSSALKNMDPSLEEAAEMSGASSLRTMMTVTFPLILPAIVSGMLLSFIVMLGIYGIPAVLGTPAKIPVLTTYIYTLTAWSPPLYSTAAAVAILLMVVTGALVWVQNRVLSGRSYTTVAGKAFRPRPLRLGPWRFLTLGLAILYLFIVVILPCLALIVAAFRKFLFVRDLASLFDPAQYSMIHFNRLFSNPQTAAALWNTLEVGLITAVVGGTLSFAIGYTIVRTRAPGRRARGSGVDDPRGDPRVGDWRGVSLGVDRAAGRVVWDDLDPGAGVRGAVHSGHGEGFEHVVDADSPGAGGGGVDLRAGADLDGGDDRAAVGAAGGDCGDDAAVHSEHAGVGVFAVSVFQRVDGDGGAASEFLRGRQHEHHGGL